jgi:hypothetical protein
MNPNNLNDLDIKYIIKLKEVINIIRSTILFMCSTNWNNTKFNNGKFGKINDMIEKEDNIIIKKLFDYSKTVSNININSNFLIQSMLYVYYKYLLLPFLYSNGGGIMCDPNLINYNSNNIIERKFNSGDIIYIKNTTFSTIDSIDHVQLIVVDHINSYQIFPNINNEKFYIVERLFFG